MALRRFMDAHRCRSSASSRLPGSTELPQAPGPRAAIFPHFSPGSTELPSQRCIVLRLFLGIPLRELEPRIHLVLALDLHGHDLVSGPLRSQANFHSSRFLLLQCTLELALQLLQIPLMPGSFRHEGTANILFVLFPLQDTMPMVRLQSLHFVLRFAGLVHACLQVLQQQVFLSCWTGHLLPHTSIRSLTVLHFHFDFVVCW